MPAGAEAYLAAELAGGKPRDRCW